MTTIYINIFSSVVSVVLVKQQLCKSYINCWQTVYLCICLLLFLLSWISILCVFYSQPVFCNGGCILYLSAGQCQKTGSHPVAPAHTSWMVWLSFAFMVKSTWFICGAYNLSTFRWHYLNRYQLGGCKLKQNLVYNLSFHVHVLGVIEHIIWNLIGKNVVSYKMQISPHFSYQLFGGVETRWHCLEQNHLATQ